MSILRVALCRSHLFSSPYRHIRHHRQMSMDAKAAASQLINSGIFKTQGFIGGKWVDSYDGETFEVRNPATGDVIANVSSMGRKETSDAITSSSSTFCSWSKLTANKRSKCLRKWSDLIIARKEDLALLITLEQGKPLKEAQGEVNYGASFIEFFAEEAKRVYGDIIPPTLADRRLFVLKQGALNVVMGKASIGDTLLESTQVRKITFTGSTAVGKKLMAGSASMVKKLAAKFRNSGQTCVCANRIMVQEDLIPLLVGIYEKFANAFAKAVQNLQVGNGLVEGVAQGPLINEAAIQKVESFVKDATSKGANVMLGGRRHSLGMTFYEPTVLRNVTSDMLISREEVFGPVAPLLLFKSEEEAIHMANDTNAGLASYIFTKSISRSWRVSEALEYGLVGVNEGLISTEVAPFGGYKQSGIGRERFQIRNG